MDHNVAKMSFPAAAARPDGYPETLPFIPDCRTLVMQVEETKTVLVAWMMVPDAPGRFAEVAEWHRDGGWTDEGSSPVEASGKLAGEWLEGKDMSEEDLARAMQGVAEMLESMRTICFAKDDLERQVSLAEIPGGPSSINLVEKRNKAPE